MKQPCFKESVKPRTQSPLMREDQCLTPSLPCCVPRRCSQVIVKPLQGTPSLAGVHTVSNLESLLEHPSSAL